MRARTLLMRVVRLRYLHLVDERVPFRIVHDVEDGIVDNLRRSVDLGARVAREETAVWDVVGRARAGLGGIVEVFARECLLRRHWVRLHGGQSGLGLVFGITGIERH